MHAVSDEEAPLAAFAGHDQRRARGQPLESLHEHAQALDRLEPTDKADARSPYACQVHGRGRSEAFDVHSQGDHVDGPIGREAFGAQHIRHIMIGRIRAIGAPQHHALDGAVRPPPVAHDVDRRIEDQRRSGRQDVARE